VRSRRRGSPPLTIALFVRHGQTPTTGKVLPGRARGLHLAEEGRAQAQRAAERIAGLPRPPVAVYSSPLERARETAAPIARALGQRVQIHRGLAEIDVGDWTGAELRQVSKSSQWWAVRHWPTGFRFPEGESFREASARMTDLLVDLVDRHRGSTFVAVSHADPIKAVVAATAGLPLDLFQRLVISPASISALGFGEDGPYVLCVNSTGSLSELAVS